MPKKRPDIELFLVNNVVNHPHDLSAYAAHHFGLTVQAIQRHLAKLIKDGAIEKRGSTRNTTYHPTASAPQNRMPSAPLREWDFKVGPQLDEQNLWEQTLKPELKSLPKNIFDICEYGFTEMVNNVKDHAQATQLTVAYKLNKSFIELDIRDDGIGIFKKLAESFSLPNLREAVLHLSKGKLTTDSSRHTGEGIFFSSRVFDEYYLLANGLMYGRINTKSDEDWLIGEEDGSDKGTIVRMRIAVDSTRTRDEVFQRFTSSEDFSFSKTHVAVELGMTEGETYVSRSQAKRILSGLSRFRFITLNFKRVQSVGQGFVDEVFRVFANEHPEITIDYIHASPSVEFMIRRALA